LQYASNAETLALQPPSSEPAVQLLVPAVAGSARDHAEEDPSGDDGGVVVALGTSMDDEMAHLRAGEATSVVLLTATALGLASCPVIVPLADATMRELLRERVFDVDGAVPQMLVRIGWAPVNADSLSSTPRRELAEVVEWLDTDGEAP
jgi:nitroreductase